MAGNFTDTVDANELRECLDLAKALDAKLQHADPEGWCDESQNAMKDLVEALEMDGIRAEDDD